MILDPDSERKVHLHSAAIFKEVRKHAISFRIIGNRCTSFKIQKGQKGTYWKEGLLPPLFLISKLFFIDKTTITHLF